VEDEDAASGSILKNSAWRIMVPAARILTGVDRTEQTPMQARGALMKEHRLIERMLSVVRVVLAKVDSTQQVDPELVAVAVDFIRTYADRTHHGKEEDILFRELSTRELSAEDRRAMDELIADHAFGRKTTAALARANERYRDGDRAALTTIVRELRTLCEFYPPHIEREDKVFFPATRAYFTDAEDQAMLAQFWAFDRAMIHEKYTRVVEGLETR
jgi:hemerythrin-like domain-containing protein